jgi:hypothetical protein
LSPAAHKAGGPDLLARVRAEIDARMGELHPAVEEYEGLLVAAEALERERAGGSDGATRARRAATKPRRGARKAERAGGPVGAVQTAIVAALEHGSHTLPELVVVTAASAAQLRASLRPLLRAGVVTRAKREGKLAYALAATA